MSDNELASEPVETPPDEIEGPLGRRRRFADSYGLVLLLLVISYFCAAALGDYTWGRVVVVFVLAAATWLALRASEVKRRPMRIAQALIPVLCVDEAYIAAAATVINSAAGAPTPTIAPHSHHAPGSITPRTKAKPIIKPATMNRSSLCRSA